MTSVFEDILKPNNKPLVNPVTSQSVATQDAPKPADDVAQGGGSTTAPAVNNAAPVNNTAAVTQMPKTGFNAEAAKVAQNLVNNMNSQGVTAGVTPTPATAPEQPKQMSFVDLLNAFYTPETAEERAKRERKEKWDKTAAAIGDGISALANLYYTTKGAPNSYDGTKSMSERTRQLYEKLDKDRKENDRWYLNHYMNAAKMDEEAKRYKEQIDYRDKQDALKKEQYEESIAHRNSREAVQDANTKWQQDFQQSNADWQHANTEKQQAEKNRQFWASHNLAVNNYNRQIEKDNPTVGFALGNGRKASIKKQDINAQNISYVYNKLSKEIKAKYAQEPVYKDGVPVEVYKKDENGNYVYDEKGNKVKMPVMKARKLSDNEKMAIIGEHIANYPEVQNAWKEIGGEITVPNKDGSQRPNSVQQNNESSGQQSGGSTRPWATGQTGQTRPWATGK